ncbi:AbfB domain-containing protein [Streptomyces sp. NPDC057539]|uniref:protein kinase domain-containing protein n=1 Tax=Streptomyces sp. NPDC057539 TaxID=3346159 RepID=UPI0036AF8214
MRDQLLGERYRLARQLGEGGMGQVWEARDETLGRSVAVKVISLLAGGGSRGDDARARFLREARITAQLQHPSIVTIHDFGETGTGDNRAPFLVMELVRGEGLEVVLGRGAATLANVARWGAQVSDALAAAHDAGIVHRDIKPSNILITPSGEVKVLDFGIARAADPSATGDRLTQTGFIVGTPVYMAPEQARGYPEPRSDLYALGCLLFELITGRPPFQAPDTAGYLTAHLTQEPPAPSAVAPGVPPAWDNLVLALLHKDPDRRYPSAADLSQALRQLGSLAEGTGPALSDSIESFNLQDRFVRHANGLGEIAAVESELDRRDASFTIVDGLADSRLVSIRSLSYPDSYLRHQGYRVKLHQVASSDSGEQALFRHDATFAIVPGLADRTWISFRSYNYPDLYLRHQDSHLYVHHITDFQGRQDATFRIRAGFP